MPRRRKRYKEILVWFNPTENPDYPKKVVGKVSEDFFEHPWGWVSWNKYAFARSPEDCRTLTSEELMLYMLENS